MSDTESKMKHVNNGACPKCAQLINKYPGMNKDLLEWFQSLQDKHPSAHISCAGRGRADQEAAFDSKSSKAHYGQSAHNYNCAIDLFVIQQGLDLYDKGWFHSIVEPNLEPFLKWYGEKGAVFYELPHVEIAEWRDLKAKGVAVLVEE